MMSKITVKQLFIHPIKGLTPQKCDRVTLKVGHGIPGDRAFALMYLEDNQIPPTTAVPWLNKQHFAMQNDWHGLAALDCYYDANTGNLTVKRQGVKLLVADTLTPTGRQLISTFFTGYLAGINPAKTARPPQLAPLQLIGDGRNSRYPDREAVHISLVSQATLDNLSEIAGKSIDVRRFRPNIVVNGIPAWSEFDWVGKEIQIGTAKIAVTARINRCLNIEVDPETGKRDINLLRLLKEHFQHTQTGVLAEVIEGGKVTVTDSLIVG